MLITNHYQKGGNKMKLKKIISTVLAATLGMSAFSGFAVNSAYTDEKPAPVI